MLKYFLCNAMMVMICPSSDLLIQDCDKFYRGACEQGAYCFSSFFQKSFYSFLGGFNKQFSLIFPQVETEKIEAIINISDFGLL